MGIGKSVAKSRQREDQQERYFLDENAGAVEMDTSGLYTFTKHSKWPRNFNFQLDMLPAGLADWLWLKTDAIRSCSLISL
jgi:hypothetical protein